MKEVIVSAVRMALARLGFDASHEVGIDTTGDGMVIEIRFTGKGAAPYAKSARIEIKGANWSGLAGLVMK